jgi:hypothetical protein
VESTPTTTPVPAPRATTPLDVGVLVRRTHDLLAAGVPLTLLLDLAEDDGPRSQQRYAEEPPELSWLSD